MPAGPSPRHPSHLRLIPRPPPSPPPVTGAPRPQRTSRVARLLSDLLGHPHGYDPAAYDEAFARDVATKGWKVFGPGRYFDVDIRGLEHVPDRPVMLVSNHSGGTTAPDVWGLGLSWYRRFGFSRPLYFMCHELLFALPPAARFFERIGALRASRETARRIVESGRDVLVFPGGDLDVWRPYSKRYHADFHGRRGFARLSKELDVPILPVAHAGAHEGLRVLRSGRRLAKAVGLHRLARAEIWPISLMFPWGLTFGPMPHLPPPGRFRYLVGEPLLPAAAERPELLADATQAAVQRQLAQLEREAHARG